MTKQQSGGKCPICNSSNKDIEGKPGPYFPFCSKRCKLVDLANWMQGSYTLDSDSGAVDESEQGD